MITRAHPRRYAPHLPPVYININRAGSVGKTTFGMNASVQAVVKRGLRGLFIDADLQSDASRCLGYDGDLIEPGTKTIHDVMLGTAKLSEATVPARTRIAWPEDPAKGEEAQDPYDPSLFQIIDGLDLVRGDAAMEQADTELAASNLAEMWLLRALRDQIEAGQYDFIWIDAPASLGRLTISLLMAATEVVLCLKPGDKELRGALVVSEKIDMLRAAQADLGASAHLAWVLINEAKKHESQGKFYMRKQDQITTHFGDAVLPQIGPTSLVPEAYEAQEPLMFWAPNAPVVKTIDIALDQMGFPPILAA